MTKIRKISFVSIAACLLVLATVAYIYRGTILVHCKLFMLSDSPGQSRGTVLLCDYEMYDARGDDWARYLIGDYFYVDSQLKNKLGASPEYYRSFDEFWVVWHKESVYYSLKSWYDLGYLGFALSVSDDFPEDIVRLSDRIVDPAKKTTWKSPPFFPLKALKALRGG